jgi:NAD(P)-dependent dehydrogenase (short-subunit alcohol dehydrogenase family)
MKLLDKVAVITGGSSRIGLATARKFFDEEAYVFITGHRRSEPEQARKQIGGNVTAVQRDVADLDRLYQSVAEEKGVIDVAFANAVELHACLSEKSTALRRAG